MPDATASGIVRAYSGGPGFNQAPVRLLVSARLIQPANSVFLSQQISTSQPKPAQKLTSEHVED